MALHGPGDARVPAKKERKPKLPLLFSCFYHSSRFRDPLSGTQNSTFGAASLPSEASK